MFSVLLLCVIVIKLLLAIDQNATRMCGDDSTWSDSDVSYCSSLALAELQMALQKDSQDIATLIDYTIELSIIITMENAVAILPRDLIVGNAILTSIIK